MASELDNTLRKHRRRLIEREEAVFNEMLAAYEDVRRELERQIRAIERRIREARAAGEEISPSWFYRERRLRTLVDQVNAEVIRFGGTVARLTTAEQRAAINIAMSNTAEILRITAPKFSDVGAMLPTRAIENAVGIMGDGSPVLDYWIENVAPDVARALRTELLKAAATGTDLRTVAKRLRAAGDITKRRSLIIARTEVNRVRRETTRQIYDDIEHVREWEWVASKSRRTCAACLAMDGRRFKVSEPFPQHINCRCTMIPVIDGVERPPRTIGSKWLAAQPEDVQRHILGDDLQEAYANGDIELKDVVGWRTHKIFGRSIYTKSAGKLLAGAR